MSDLRFALFGAGFWARYQLAAWQELSGAQCIAICDPAREKAEALAQERNVPAIYTDPEELIAREKPDFLDLVTPPETHAALTLLAAAHKTPVICQKPMATSLAEAEQMVAACRATGTPFFVHENWRWQTPIRQFKHALEESRIGKPFRARIRMVSGFPVFINQPFLKELAQFVLTDMGSHLLDTARLYFGEAQRLYCQTHRVHADIKGEDVATVMMEMNGVTVLCELGYAENYLEHDAFPQTTILVEADKGSAELDKDYWIRVTTKDGTHAKRYPPPRYTWADPAYDVGQSALVACHADLLSALRGEGTAETTGEDNLKTMRLMFAAYDSAATGKAIAF